MNPFKAIAKYLFEPTELEHQRARLRGQLAELAQVELRNANALAASRLEQLAAAGVPFHVDPAPPVAQQSKPSFHPVYIYETDQATGYPLVPAMRYEQDPIFGWLDGIGWDLSSDVPLGSFPREMFPERPTTLRTQIAQDAIRYQSRAWYETLPQYSGPIGHLRNYIIGAGLTIDVVVTDKDEGEGEGEASYEQDEPAAISTDAGNQAEKPIDPDEGLANEIQEYLDGFAKYKQNNLHRRMWDSVLNLFRDGEDALRIFPNKAGRDDYPQVRSVDTSTIRGPHNEITGPWAYGVLTSWPTDFEDVKAYHLWYSDNTHEDIVPELLHVCKLDTTGANVKRGVPLAYKIRKQLPQIAKLLDCMAVGEAARQAIPYVQQYSMADKASVKMATPSALDQYDSMAQGWLHHHGEIEPGAVQHISRGMEFQQPPSGESQSGVLAYRTLCESIACALNCPIWFITGSADSENYASSLVSESPVTKLIIHYQQLMTDHYKAVCEAVVEVAAAQGVFPVDWKERVEIHAELPSPIARDPDKAIDSDLKLLDKKLLSPQHLCVRNNLDFEEETDLIAQAEAMGWQAQTEMELAQAGQLNDQADGGGPPKPPQGE